MYVIETNTVSASFGKEIDGFSMSHAMDRHNYLILLQNMTLVCARLFGGSIKINSLSFNHCLSAKLKLFWNQIVLQLAFMKQHIQICQFSDLCLTWFLEWFPLENR